MHKHIDLNSDLGESFGPWVMGDDAAMLSCVTSANIACGGHASDPETMFATLLLAKQSGVVVGAHPGYNDREGFGRRIISMLPEHVGRVVVAQIGALQALAALAGVKVQYVKTHGALGNLAAADLEVANAVVSAVQQLDPGLAMLVISGTQLAVAAKAHGTKVYSEVFADRGYLSSGQLVPRSQPGAMIHDVSQATERLLGFLETGLMPVIDGEPIPLEAESICVHGDSAGAVTMARELRSRLEAEGIRLASFVAR